MTTRQHAALVALLSAAAPVAALASERFLGMAPCALCLWQRWPYLAAAVIAVLAAGLRSRALLALAGVAVLASGAIAGLHVGVEQGWWPSPLASCAAPDAGAAASVDDLLRGLAPRPDKPCDAAAYPIPGLPVSLAAMNLAYALALGALALTWAGRGSRQEGRA
ncbi:disulfide bond formation protein B [Pararoseomonas sp. SCSIO 73927]|uniref:disulfide bond formation protein B n=1 Tax=Pararoseomonas sp. SCSIO 73927 TaxID=3114537 RepID=UPI0030CAAE8E